MRILIWHGYLLGGTGSNVYTRSLARTWSRQGHDVVVLCQEPDPENHDVGGARVVRPRLDGGLPVFVMDHYADAEPVLVGDMGPSERHRFVEVNADALRAELPADIVLVNHVLLGAAVGAAAGTPFIVKAHGSELEFAIRGNAELTCWARDSLASADAVVVGSRHTADVLEQVVGPGRHSDRTHIVAPGVDIDMLRPQARDAALTSLVEQCRRDAPNPGKADQRRPDEGNADRLAAFLADDAPTVLYVGKLSDQKGVALLLEALHSLEARAVIAGFGPARTRLEAIAPSRTLFTGALEHRHLAHLWPLADVAVTPSVFPEAFGMVAAEAASCGCPPLVARHSGLAEIAAAVAAAYPPAYGHLTSFDTGSVDDLRTKLSELLALPPPEWGTLSRAARTTAVRTWSWDTVATRLARVAATRSGSGP
ncbi:MAG: glycosyltransferase [Nitriliruptorales bacterium]|nr:glycosyltransferase [Nitriliruptorales bacterium]